MSGQRSARIAHLVPLPSTTPEETPEPPMADEPIDILTDFDRGAERLPSELADKLRDRQRSVSGKRRRAQLNEDLLRFRVRGWLKKRRKRRKT